MEVLGELSSFPRACFPHDYHYIVVTNHTQQLWGKREFVWDQWHAHLKLMPMYVPILLYVTQTFPWKTHLTLQVWHNYVLVHALFTKITACVHTQFMLQLMWHQVIPELKAEGQQWHNIIKLKDDAYVHIRMYINIWHRVVVWCMEAKSKC